MISRVSLLGRFQHINEGSRMSAVVQSSARPLVVLEQNRLVSQALLGRLSVHGGMLYRVTDLHRCAIALRAQQATPVLVLAGKPPENLWVDWITQVRSVIRASCPILAVDGREASATTFLLTIQDLPDAVALDNSTREVVHSLQALIEREGTTTLAYGPLHLDRTHKTLGAAGRSVPLKDIHWRLLLLFWTNPLRTLPIDLLQKALNSTKPLVAREAYLAIHQLRSYLRYLGFDDCIVTLRGRGYQFIPPNSSLQDFRNDALVAEKARNQSSLPSTPVGSHYPETAHRS